MDTQKNETKNSTAVSYPRSGLIHKTVASLVTVFFILGGIPVPTSFAANAPLIKDETQKAVPIVTLAQANAQTAAVQSPVPSGAAINSSSPLTAPTTQDLPKKGDLTSVASSLQTNEIINPVEPTAVSFNNIFAFSSAQPPSTAALRQISSEKFAMDFDVTTIGSYVGTVCSFDNFGTGEIETYDLRGALLGMTLRLSSGTGSVKLEMEDIFNRRTTFLITGLTTTEQERRIYPSQMSNPSFDFSQVKNINFVIENTRVSEKRSSLEVEFGHFPYTPVINQTTVAPLTNFSALKPSASKIEAVPNTTVMNFTQPSPDQFSFNYNLPAGGSQRWAAAQIYFPNGQFFNLAAASGVVLNVAVTGARYYKLEFNDMNGKKVTLRVNVTNGSVLVTDALLQSAGVVGFDSTKIQGIVVVVDDPSAATGTVTVNTKGLQYTPVITGTLYNQALITQMTNQPVLGASSGIDQGVINLTQPSSSNFSFNYSLPSSGNFVFANLGNGYFNSTNNTWVGTTMNLSGGVTFAVNGPSGKQLKVEVIDKNNVRAIYYLNLTGSKQNYSLNLTGMGIDPANVAQIVFVAEQSRMGSSGQVAVEMKGLAYTPVISSPTTAALTDFSALQPSVTSVEAVHGTTVMNFMQSSPDQFSFDYNLPAGGSQRWAAGMILFQPGQYFDATLSGIVLDVHLTGASHYNLEVEDVSGKKVTVRVNVMNGRVEVTNALLQSAGVAGFDATEVKAIVLVVNDPMATGHMTVNTKGLLYESVVPTGWTRATSNPDFAFRTESAYVANGIYNISVKVLNLSTGIEKVVISGQSFPYAHPTGPYDVSSDGSVVICGFENSHGTVLSGGPQYVVILKRFSDLTQSLTLTGGFESVEFSNGQAVISTKWAPVTPRYTVKLSDFTVVNTLYELKDQQGEGVTYDQASKLTAQVIRVNGTYRIRIFDSTSGTDKMALLKDRAVTTGYPNDQVTFVKIIQTPQGRGIVSYSAETYAPSLSYDYKTTVLDPRTGQELIFDGRATSVTYEGAIAAYQVTHRSGTTGVVYVDLRTLTLTTTQSVTVTPAISNLTPSGFKLSFQSTGLQTGDGASAALYLNGQAVAANGLVVTDPNNTNYRETTFTNLVAGKTYTVVLKVERSGQVISQQTLTVTTATPPVPAGWTAMPGNTQLAFKVENGTPMVLDLQTNAARPMVVRDITSMNETDMLGYFTHVTGFPVQGISLTAAVINYGRVRPVVQVAYILKTPMGNFYQSQGTLFFDLEGKLENAQTLADDIPVAQADITSPSVVLPGNITATTPTAAGLVTLRGTKSALNSVWYSLDNGVTYRQLVAPNGYTSWAANIYLPVGASTILIKTKKVQKILGVNTILSSAPVRLAPITYSAPTVAAPANVTATAPTAAGLVTLRGAKAAGTSIWYSLDNGVTYRQLVASNGYASWSGNIYLPVGTSNILVQARKTVVVSGVSTVISSAPARLAPITYTAPTVAAPANITATGPNARGVVTLRGTKATGTSIWYSLDNGATYRQLVAPNGYASWAGNITLPVGTSTLLIQARKSAVVSGVTTTLLSAAVTLAPIIRR